MRSKVKVALLALLVSAGIAACWAAPAALHGLIHRSLQDFFKGAQVSSGRLSLETPLALAVADVRVEAEGYVLTVQKAAVDLRARLTLTRPRLIIRKVPAEWRSSPRGSGEAVGSEDRFVLSAVRADDLTVEFKLPGFTAAIHGSAECDLKSRAVRTAHLECPTLKSGALKIREIRFDLPEDGPGALRIASVAIGKFKVSGIESGVVWEETTVLADPVTGSWVKGAVGGRARFEAQEPFGYEAAFEIRELDLDAFTEAMDLKKKVSADGKLSGRVFVRGDVSGIRSLEGKFEAGEAGGDLVIRDPNFLKYLAENTRQPIALVEAAFKEYHFDTGTVAMTQNGRDLGFAVGMDGAKGRRRFEINLHDQL